MAKPLTSDVLRYWAVQFRLFQAATPSLATSAAPQHELVPRGSYSLGGQACLCAGNPTHRRPVTTPSRRQGAARLPWHAARDPSSFISTRGRANSGLVGMLARPRDGYAANSPGPHIVANTLPIAWNLGVSDVCSRLYIRYGPRNGLACSSRATSDDVVSQAHVCACATASRAAAHEA